VNSQQQKTYYNVPHRHDVPFYIEQCIGTCTLALRLRFSSAHLDLHVLLPKLRRLHILINIAHLHVLLLKLRRLHFYIALHGVQILFTRTIFSNRFALFSRNSTLFTFSRNSLVVP